MAFSKIIFNGTTLMDVTTDTVDANNLLSGNTATGADGVKVQGAYVPSGGNDFIVTLSEVNDVWTPDKTFAEIKAAYDAGKNIIVKASAEIPPEVSGYFTSGGLMGDQLIYTVSISGNVNHVVTEYSFDANNGVQEISKYTSYVTDNATITAADVTSGKIAYGKNGKITGTSTAITPSGSLDITTNGTHDVTNYASANVNVSNVDIPIFTSNTEATTITCNKTYAECYELVSGGDNRALLDAPGSEDAGTSGMKGVLSARMRPDSGEPLRYYYTLNGIPTIQVNYDSDGTLTLSSSPDTLEDATFTENGDYGGGSVLYKYVTVDVQPSLETTTVTPTESQQTITPSSGYDGFFEVTVNAIDANYVGSGIQRRTSLHPSPTGNSIIAESGYYPNTTSYIISSNDLQNKTVTPTKSQQIITKSSEDGYIGLGTVTVEAIPSEYIVPTGSLDITTNGTHDVTNYATANVNVEPSLEPIVVSPTEDIQTIKAGEKFKFAADKCGFRDNVSIVFSYDTSNLNLENGKTYHVTGTLARPAKGRNYTIDSDFVWNGFGTSIVFNEVGESRTVTAVLNQTSIDINVDSTDDDNNENSIDITITEPGIDGFSQVTVNAISSSYVGSEVTRRSSSDLAASGAKVTVPAGYYESQASKTVHSGSATTPATTITANPSISISDGGLITATASATKDVKPTISAGYVSSGTSGTVTVSGSNTSQLTVQAAKTVTPTEEEQTAVVKGVYTTGIVKVGAIPSNYVGSGVTQRDETDLTASGATVTVPAGYYAEQETKSVSTTTHPSPTASINSTTGLVTASHTQTAGYVSAGTTTGTLQLTTQAAATITPSETSQTAVSAGKYTTGAVTVAAISSTYVGSGVTRQAAKTVTPTKSSQQAVASGVYTTGAVTVAAIPADYITTTDATATAAQINSGATAYVNGTKVTGTQVIKKYYTGTEDPSASQYNDGDIYLKVVG